MLIIEGYQKYRMLGLTHRESREKAVLHVKESHPNMRVSVREVDRVLAVYHSDFDPKRMVPSIVVERKLEDVPIFGDAALGSRVVKFEKKEVLAFSLRERPKYQKRPKKLPRLNHSPKFK